MPHSPELFFTTILHVSQFQKHSTYALTFSKKVSDYGIVEP